MKVLNRRRVALLCAGLGSVGAVSAFTFGATSAQFTAQGLSQNNTITDGTIVLHTDNGAGTVPALSVPVLNPGDAYCNPGYFSSGTCPGGQTPISAPPLYTIAYAGTSDAFVGLDMTVSSTAAKACTTANGATSTLTPSTTGILPSAVTAACSGLNAIGTLPVFDGDAALVDLMSASSNPSASQIPLIKDSDFDSAATCSTDVNSVVTCLATVKNVELSAYNPTNLWSNPGNDQEWPGGLGGYVQIALSIELPQSVTNAVQGSGATVTLAAHAVQVANNLASVTAGSPNANVCDTAAFLPSVKVVSTASYCPASWS